MSVENNPKVYTPVPPQRQFPQEEPNSGRNKGIHQKPDPGEKMKDKGEQPKR